MLNSLFLAIRLLILVSSGHKQVVLENIALRDHLAVFTREKKGVLRQNPSALSWKAERNRVNTLTQPWSSSLISACSISAFNAAICRRISAFSRPKDSRDLNSDRIKCQLK